MEFTPPGIRTVDIEYELNGNTMVETVPTGKRLLDHLRDHHGLLSVKEGCGTGECGACTILMNGKPVCSCLILAPQVEGKRIITLEGIWNGTELSPVQAAFVEEGSVQCGFCTPGMILTAVALLRENPEPTVKEIRKAISGNLCRCTGYSKIIKGIQKAARELQGGGD